MPREAVTKFLSNCSTCVKLTKTNNSDFNANEIDEEDLVESSSNSRDTVTPRRELTVINNHKTLRDPQMEVKMKQTASEVVSTYLKLTRTLGLPDCDALPVDYLKVSLHAIY